MPDDLVVSGLIGKRWHFWGGVDGAFGRPLGPEEDVPGRNGRRQRFERGEIAWSPDQGMVVSVFRLRNEACFIWSRPQFEHDFFVYNVIYRAVGQEQGESQGPGANVKISGEGDWTEFQQWTRLQGFGEFSFLVMGSHGSETIPVRLRLGPFADPDPNDPQVHGVLAERWHELDAWTGPLGKPISVELVNPADGVRGQLFEHGQISTSPNFGVGMVIAAYQRGSFIEVSWGGSVGTTFNAFRMDVYFNNIKFLEKLVHVNLPTEWARSALCSGQFRFHPTRGDGFYGFIIWPSSTISLRPLLAPSLEPGVTVDPVVSGPADLGNIVDFPFGHTPRVDVRFKYGPFDAFLDPPAIDGTPAHAFASHGTRASAIARHFARIKPLYVAFPLRNLGKPEATEDDTLQLIAHLQAVSEDPDFRVPGEMPSRILAHIRLRQLERGHGRVGTQFGVDDDGSTDVVFRKGDYDMALKGLMVIAYRYRHLLTSDDVNFILDKLVPSYLVGPHDPALEKYTVFDPFEDVPETENHMLMINSTRYLVNQLFFDRTGDKKYNNRENGLVKWLLNYMHTIAKHDFLEFNARPYQRLSLHVLFNLHEFARDREIRTAAQILLDYTMVKFAVSSNRQRRICPFRRLKEYTNHPNNEHNELLAPQGKGKDAVIGFFLMYAGPTDREGKPTSWFTGGWAFEALIAGLAAYRPPPAAYIIAMTPPPDPAQHRFYHGARPVLPGTDDQADGGVEIYYSSPSFLLTAGGMFLNSGYGGDEFSDAQVAIAQSTTLLPTRADVKFADLIRFDPGGGDRFAVNTGVHLGFACGTNLHVPDRWLQLTAAHWDGPWLFLDLNSESLGPSHHQLDRRLGFYVAAYRTPFNPTNHPFLASVLGLTVKNLGFLYAVESKNLNFNTFEQSIRNNNNLPPELVHGDTYMLKTHDGHSFTFTIAVFGAKYLSRILAMDGQQLLSDFTSLPLVEGEYLNSKVPEKAPGGHEGYLEVRHPGCGTPLILDFRNPENPRRVDNMRECPQPWLDRADALAAFAQKLKDAKKYKEAAAAALERVKIYQQLVEVDPVKYKAYLGSALVYDLIGEYRTRLDAASALAFAEQGVRVYEELTGLRPVGSSAPVDYQNLGGFTPNVYWEWPYFDYALFLLAHVHHEAKRYDAGAAVALQRLRLNERLAAVDPAKGKPAMASALNDLVAYFWSVLDASAAMAFAQQAVQVYEELAGLHPQPVNYQKLSEFHPNPYWDQGLGPALYNLPQVQRAAGDWKGAAATAIKYVRVYERLAQHDPTDAHKHSLGWALLIPLLGHYWPGLDNVSALAFAKQAVWLYEELAGLGPQPVNYQNLAGFTPNDYWVRPDSVDLSRALWTLAHVHNRAEDRAAAAAVMLKQVRLYERLAQADPTKYQAALAQAYADAAAFGT